MVYNFDLIQITGQKQNLSQTVNYGYINYYYNYDGKVIWNLFRETPTDRTNAT